MNVVKYVSQSIVPFLVYVAAVLALIVGVFIDARITDVFTSPLAYAAPRQILTVKEASYLPPQEARSQLRDKDGLVELLKFEGGGNVFNALRRRAPQDTKIVLEKVRLDNTNLSGINLVAAQLPWSKMRETNFSRAKLLGIQMFHCHCHHTNFTEADLSPFEGRRTNLGEAFLNGANFTNANLQQVGLMEASLVEAVFDGAEIGQIDARYANWPYASLRGVTSSSGPIDFEQSVGAYADLTDARLNGVKFRKATLSNANLTRADLSNGTLQDAEMRGVIIDHTNFKGANLSSANLYYTDLRTADMRNTDLTGAGLLGVNASKVDFTGATLNFVNADFANLSGSNLQKVSMKEAALSGANLSNTNLENADLSHANLTGAKLVNARVKGAIFSGSDLSDVDFTGTDLDGANLNGAKINNPIIAQRLISKGLNNSMATSNLKPLHKPLNDGDIESIHPAAFWIRKMLGELKTVTEMSKVGDKAPRFTN